MRYLTRIGVVGAMLLAISLAGCSAPAADPQVSGTTAAAGMVAFNAYVNFDGSIDETCAAINRDKFVVAMIDFKVTKADALAGLEKICTASAGQTVGKEAAANDLLGVLLHQGGYGMKTACEAGMSDKIASGAAEGMAAKGRPALTKQLFLEQLRHNCSGR